MNDVNGKELAAKQKVALAGTVEALRNGTGQVGIRLDGAGGEPGERIDVNPGQVTITADAPPEPETPAEPTAANPDGD